MTGRRGRPLKQRVRRAKGRRTSSTRWLARQLNDPYVARARDEGLRSRAAFKLIDLDDRFHFLGRGKRVLDLGAAPGGWTLVAVRRSGPVVAVDHQEMDPVPGATFIRGDIRDAATVAQVRAALDDRAEVVLSDMAPPATGHRGTDHLRIMALCEEAAALALELLAPGGAFVAKVLRGGAENTLLVELKRRFDSVRHVKPPASRADSAETYVVALGFRDGARG